MHTLAIPVPPQLEAAWGYEGDARWVAGYWERAGDELAWTDGWRSVCDAPWEGWLLYTRHPTVRPALAAYDLGSSDAAARHWLLLERQERAAWIAPVEEAWAHLQAQWLPAEEHPLAGTTEDRAPGASGLEWRLWTEAPGEVSVSPVEVRARMATQHRRVEDLARWLDLMTNSRPG